MCRRFKSDREYNKHNYYSEWGSIMDHKIVSIPEMNQELISTQPLDVSDWITRASAFIQYAAFNPLPEVDSYTFYLQRLMPLMPPSIWEAGMMMNELVHIENCGHDITAEAEEFLSEGDKDD